ncbi:MAG: erythromycin esterase family protein [Acidobacteriia bacterium]|nr:erythromycin esterase family protein [Terriglobia bacterium]
MKHRLLEYLAQNKGFTNAAGNGPILFTGFDMQFTQGAIPNVEDFVARAEPAYLATVRNAYSLAQQVVHNSQTGTAQTADNVQPVVDALHAIGQHLAQNRSLYLGLQRGLRLHPTHSPARFSAREVDWAIQNAVIVEQATYQTIAPATYRDQAMASNMEWILPQDPGARAVVWAHDRHVWKEPQAMGSFRW